MKLPRRQFLHLAAGAAALPAVSRLAWAQAYPSRPVTVVAFVGAGGTPDIIARLLGQALTQRLGQSMVVDNRPGAGGKLALQAVARAPADGYTLLQVATPHAINVTLYEKGNVNVARDIVPIAGTNYVLVNPSFPAKMVPEFIAYAKANPGKVNLGSSGSGNLSHLAAELFRMLTGIEVVHVPFRGTPATHPRKTASKRQISTSIEAQETLKSIVSEGKRAAEIIRNLRGQASRTCDRRPARSGEKSTSFMPVASVILTPLSRV